METNIGQDNISGPGCVDSS